MRRRVLAAAEELGYRSNNAARALASGRTRSIGVVTLGTALYGPASLLMGVERAVRDTGYALRVVNTMEGERGGHRRRRGLAPGPGRGRHRHLRADRRGGRRGSLRTGRRAGPRPRRTPPFAAPQVVTAGIVSGQMARAATEHLLELGHTTVHHLAGPQRWYSARDRLDGWREALAAHGRAEPPVARGRLVGRLRLRGRP